MLIPLSTDRPSKRPAMVTPVLVGLNLAVFAAMLFLPMVSGITVEDIYRAGAVGGGRIVWYTPVTSAFLHAGFVHLIGNMIALWVFGPPVEDRFGRVWFVVFYFTAAIASGLIHGLLETAPAIGASGAIAGVTGAFLVLFPATHIKCFSFIFVLGLVMVPAWFLIGLSIAFDLFSQSFGVQNDVANIAHLAGYGFGAFVSLGLLWSGLLAREPYDLFTMLRHRNRRRVIRAAAAKQAASGPMRAAKSSKPDPQAEELARRRATVSTLLAEDKLAEAADAYQELTDAYAHRPHAGTLSRDAQLKLAGYLLAGGRRRLASKTLEGFLATYPNDPERGEISILLARVAAHDLGDTAWARSLLEPIAAEGKDDRLRALAREELAGIPAKEPS